MSSAFSLAHPVSLAYPPTGTSARSRATVKRAVNESASLDVPSIVSENMSLAFFRSRADVFERRL